MCLTGQIPAGWEDVRQDGHRQGWFHQQGRASGGSCEEDEEGRRVTVSMERVGVHFVPE